MILELYNVTCMKRHHRANIDKMETKAVRQVFLLWLDGATGSTRAPPQHAPVGSAGRQGHAAWHLTVVPLIVLPCLETVLWCPY
eukprot:SAG11_NODE_411_length_9696_cov_46.841513_6_plen_84_part_00